MDGMEFFNIEIDVDLAAAKQAGTLQVQNAGTQANLKGPFFGGSALVCTCAKDLNLSCTSQWVIKK